MWSWLWGGTVRRILMTVLISMVPVVELRGAIPIATANGLDLRIAIFVSILGNLIPVPFIIIFVKKIFAWLRRISPKLDHLVNFGDCSFWWRSRCRVPARGRVRWSRRSWICP